MSWLETYVENWATFKILDVDTPPQTVFDLRFKAKPRAALSGLSKMDFMITLFVSNPSSRNNFQLNMRLSSELAGRRASFSNLILKGFDGKPL